MGNKIRNSILAGTLALGLHGCEHKVTLTEACPQVRIDPFISYGTDPVVFGISGGDGNYVFRVDDYVCGGGDLTQIAPDKVRFTPNPRPCFNLYFNPIVHVYSCNGFTHDFAVIFRKPRAD